MDLYLTGHMYLCTRGSLGLFEQIDDVTVWHLSPMDNDGHDSTEIGSIYLIPTIRFYVLNDVSLLQLLDSGEL